jgi:poly(3-hydroxybutyrate) depolymerase
VPLNPEVAATREMMRRAGALASEASMLPKIEDALLPGRLSARQYWPTTEKEQPIVVDLHGARFSAAIWKAISR